MIAFVAASPSIDRQHEIDELRPGTIHRPHNVVAVAGGKALNAARAANHLGADVHAVALLGGHAGRWIADALAAEGIALHVVDGPGESRMALSVSAGGALTEFYEPPPPITATHWDALEAAIAATNADWVAISGSIPPGAPDDAYARLVHIGRRAGVRVVVDAARTALAAALGANPDAVTPNLAEADGAINGHTDEAVDEAGLDVPHRAGAAAEALCARGARSAVVTAGAAGAAYGDAAGVTWVPTVKVDVVNPIGAGDSFVAGLVRACEGGASGVDAVTFALATATASVEQDLAGGVDPRRVREILGQLGGMVKA
jgi:1-phosphofructokinase